MLWYLLYPFRRTTEPPTLSDDHLIRRAFYRHGKTTAQHWLLTMLVSVAIGVGLSYPTVFLSETPTAGLITNMPHQVWTTAKDFDGDSSIKADVEMRQIWVHGSYMRALEKDVLKQTLVMQQALLDSQAIPGLSSTTDRSPPEKSRLTWGYHSPLMYWNDSAAVLDRDDDILRTINQRAGSQSLLNIALRPASVFARNIFDGRRLKAADALVLTLMNKVGDPVSTEWRKQMQLLPQTCRNCTVIPPDGDTSDSRVYVFSFIPLSLKENTALAVAYGMLALYVLLSLRRIRAFHSRFGLVVTAITQLTTSVLASFTICGALDINLASIPKNAYPFVVLVVGLENMFRLINAILEYPSTMATELRIGHALGDIGPLKIATAVQNLLMLWALSIVVSPGVAAFCAFAAIATLFDTFFLLTFFVAVLSVDIRRLELQDALSRSERYRKKRLKSPVKRSWFDALIQGRLPFSTRMAGTAVTTTFILSLNYHFFDQREKPANIRGILRSFKYSTSQGPSRDAITSSVNLTLTPAEWMAMQGFDSAREVMQLVKPWANSFAVRAYSPLVIVLANADRTGRPLDHTTWLIAVRTLALEHLYPFAVVVSFVVTFVAVLMNFLLWSEAADEADANSTRNTDYKLTVETFGLPHKLDIVKMSSDNRGHIATVGLDRTIAISTVGLSQDRIETSRMPVEITSGLAWPVQEIIMDDHGEFAAIISNDGKISLYDQSNERMTGAQVEVPDDHPVLTAKFLRVPRESATSVFFSLITAGGRFVVINVEKGDARTGSVMDVPVLGAAIVEQPLQRNEKSLFIVSNELEMASFRFEGGTWHRHSVEKSPIETTAVRWEDPVSIGLIDDGATDTIYLLTTAWLVLVTGSTLKTVGRINIKELESPQGTPVAGQTTMCASCNGSAVRSFTIASGRHRSDECRLVAVLPSKGKAESFCLRNIKPSCGKLADSSVQVVSLPEAGQWLGQGPQSVLGLRKKHIAQKVDGAEKARSRRLHRYKEKGSGQGFQRHEREHERQKMTLTTMTDSSSTSSDWEAYKLSTDGELEAIDMVDSRGGRGHHDDELFVNKAGPVVSLNPQAAAVAFGNTIKIVRSVRRRGSSLTRPSTLAASIASRTPPEERRG